ERKEPVLGRMCSVFFNYNRRCQRAGGRHSLAQGIDPVGNGFVESLARPGGSITGFIQFEYGLAGKWMELLKEVAPGGTRVGVLREPGPAAIGQWTMIQAVAQSFGAELKPIAPATRAKLNARSRP